MIGILVALIWLIADFSKQWPRYAAAPAAAALLAIGLCIWRVPTELVYWKDSATLWSRAIAVTENNWAAHYCLGQVELNSNPDVSLSEFQKSVDIYPDLADSQRALGLALMINRNFSAAIDHFKKGIALEPQNSWAYNGLATCYFQQERYNEAVIALANAIELDPKTEPYKIKLDQFIEDGRAQTFISAMKSNPKEFEKFKTAMASDTNHPDITALLQKLNESAADK